MGFHNHQSVSLITSACKYIYYLALGISLCAAVSVWVDGGGFFQLDSELYGALVNNIKMVLIYAFIGQALMFYFCTIQHNFGHLLPMGFFLVLMIGALEFYGQVNQIPIDPALNSVFLFVGLSHMAYGAISRRQSELNNS